MNGIMNIDNRNNNISFNSRYLRINHPEKFPTEILQAVKTNEALDRFIQNGTPKSLWEKFVNLFKKDEYVDVFYGKYIGSKSSPDYYENLRFCFGDYNNDYVKTNFSIYAKTNHETATQRIRTALESITDFNNKLLKHVPRIEV